MLSSGIYTALITPFTSQNTIDTNALSLLITQQEEANITGIVLAGTTGEAITFSEDELDTVLQIGTQTTLPVIVGVGHSYTETVIKTIRHIEKYTIEAFLVVTPYYNKPTQNGLYHHFHSIATASELPIILYNVPSRTGVSLLPETVARLQNALPKKIIGIKEATSDMLTFTKLRMLCGEDFYIFSGDDATTYPSLAVGSNGAISVVSNVFPKVMLELFTAWNATNITKAKQIHQDLQEICKALFIETNPIPAKKALSIQGIIENILRLPLVPLAEEYTLEVSNILKKYK